MLLPSVSDRNHQGQNDDGSNIGTTYSCIDASKHFSFLIYKIVSIATAFFCMVELSADKVKTQTNVFHALYEQTLMN